MDAQLPSVSVTDELLMARKSIPESAVPLFIGYTEKSSQGSMVEIKTFSEYETQFGQASSGDATLYYSVKHFFDNGGKGGFVFSLGTYEQLNDHSPEDIISDLQMPELIKAIDIEESITLLAFPDIVCLPEIYSQMSLWLDAWKIMLMFCQLRSGLFAILDSPEDSTLAGHCLTNLEDLGCEWGAAYWPRLVTSYMEGEGKQPVTVPPSGAVMAAMQSTDTSKGVWSTPANIRLSQVLKPSQPHQDASALFNPQGISLNLIRSFPGRGTYIWGGRTLTNDPQSSFRYIQTRRLISYCETQLSALGRVFVFEPNNEVTWYKFKGLVYNWLYELWQQGGLYGAQEEEAFQVLIGLDETMTKDDILAGKMVMNIRLSVLAPAEFIELSLLFHMNADERV